MATGSLGSNWIRDLYYRPDTAITIPYNYGFYAGILVSATTVWWLMPLDKPIASDVVSVTFTGSISVRSKTGRTNLGTAELPLRITSTNWNPTGIRFAATHTASMGATSDPVTVAIYLQDATIRFNGTVIPV